MNIKDELIAQEEKTSAINKSEFWMKAAASVFGIWAGVVVYGAEQITSSMKELTASQISARASFNEFLISNERRITQIEERQKTVIEEIHAYGEILHRHEGRLDRLEIDGTHQSAQRNPRDKP